MNACAAMPLAAERGAGVEAEPAEPQDAGAEQRERQRVRRHRVLAASPRRVPSTSTTASAAMPALMCTTVPPAKSSAPRRNSQPAGENTQCATGAYTTSAQSPRNQTHAENFMRSAIAPVISAGVMTANIIWNAENDSGGIGTAPKPVAG